MTIRPILGRIESDHGQRPRPIEPVADPAQRRPSGDSRLFGRMKRAIRKAERRAGDGREIGGTGATILKFIPAPLVRLVERKRIGTEEVRAADDIAVAFHAQAGALILGAQNAFTPAVRVTGVGSTRNYNWITSGTWSGTLTFQRSYDSATAGFIDVSTATSNGSPTFSSSTGGSMGSPDLDNVIAWERVGFKSGGYGSGNVTVSSNYAGGGGYGIFRVTGYNSPTSVNIQVLEPFSTLQATTDWVEVDWSAFKGFPTSVAFHEGRLCWFGGNQAWLSASDDFTNYADINSDGTSTGDGGAINVTLGAGPVDTISWGLSLTRLMLGREQSIMSARSSNFDQPVTPTQIVVRDCSDQGAQRLPAIKAGKRGIFVQQSWPQGLRAVLQFAGDGL
jgi:hypothetical protein